MSILAVGLALLIGVTLGLLGGGGSILTVPVFVYAIHADPKRAIAMSLPVVGGAALVGAMQHWRRGNVNLRTALLVGAATMPGAYAGARLAAYVSGQVQLTIFSVVMLTAAISMFRNASQPERLAPRLHPSWGMLLAIGAAVGAITGFVGAGGGFLIVPALVVLGGLAMSQAIGTSLLVIALNAGAGFLGYWGTVSLDWVLVGSFGAVMAIGILVGTALVTHVSQRALKRAFAFLLVAVGSTILWRSGTSF